MNVNKQYGYLALILQAVINKFTTIENKVSPQPLGVDLRQNKSATVIMAEGDLEPKQLAQGCTEARGENSSRGSSEVSRHIRKS